MALNFQKVDKPKTKNKTKWKRSAYLGMVLLNWKKKPKFSISKFSSDLLGSQTRNSRFSLQFWEEHKNQTKKNISVNLLANNTSQSDPIESWFWFRFDFSRNRAFLQTTSFLHTPWNTNEMKHNTSLYAVAAVFLRISLIAHFTLRSGPSPPPLASYPTGWWTLPPRALG